MSKGGTATPIRLMKAAVMGVPHRKERDVERPGRESTETTQVSFGSVYESQVRLAELSFAELSLAELQFRGNPVSTKQCDGPAISRASEDHGKLAIQAQPSSSAPAALK